MRQAREELDKNDLLQASEKGWGAAAQGIKAVAQRKRWPHYEHNHLREVIGRLVEESRDAELMTCFDAASEAAPHLLRGTRRTFWRLVEASPGRAVAGQAGVLLTAFAT